MQDLPLTKQPAQNLTARRAKEREQKGRGVEHRTHFSALLFLFLMMTRPCEQAKELRRELNLGRVGWFTFFRNYCMFKQWDICQSTT